MPRVTKSVTAKAKHKKVLSAAKGMVPNRLFKTKQSNIKALQYAFRDRKIKEHSDRFGYNKVANRRFLF